MDRHKKIILRNFLLIKLLLITFSFISVTIAAGQTGLSKPVFDFKGRYIVSVSDADMVASAYLDGHLGDIEGKDALSIIRLDKPVNELKAAAIEASNSVTGPPSSVAVSPNGR